MPLPRTNVVSLNHYRYARDDEQLNAEWDWLTRLVREAWMWRDLDSGCTTRLTPTSHAAYRAGFAWAAAPGYPGEMAERSREEPTQLATRIPKELHRRLKLHCVETDTPMMDFVVAALREKLAKSGRRRRRGA